jgi:hypothetical protein
VAMMEEEWRRSGGARVSRGGGAAARVEEEERKRNRRWIGGKRTQIRFSRADRTCFLTDRTRCRGIQSESSKVQA